MFYRYSENNDYMDSKVALSIHSHIFNYFVDVITFSKFILPVLHRNDRF